jgi:hypothetical protein
VDEATAEWEGAQHLWEGRDALLMTDWVAFQSQASAELSEDEAAPPRVVTICLILQVCARYGTRSCPKWSSESSRPCDLDAGACTLTCPPEPS